VQAYYQGRVAMSNLVEPCVKAYTLLPEVPLTEKGLAMKTRPIGEIVAGSDTLNLILRMDVQDPKKGYAMRLSELLNGLSEGQLIELKGFLQENLNIFCNKAERKIEELLAQKAIETEQPELELESPDADELEIPTFIRRNHC